MAQRSRVTGTVRQVNASMAMLAPSRDSASVATLAMMIESGQQFAGLPLDAFLAVGDVLAGEFDAGTLRFHPDFGEWSDFTVFTRYPEGSVALGLVGEVTRQHSVVFLHPSFPVRMGRGDVSANPKDVVDHLWSTGDVVRVRVVRDKGGNVALRATDIDDDEPALDAPELFEGKGPWLTGHTMSLIEATKNRWEAERRAQAELARALEVLAKTMQIDANEIETRLSSTTDASDNPSLPSSASRLSSRERSNLEFFESRFRKMMANYQVELGKLAKANAELAEKLRAAAEHEEKLAREVESLRSQLSASRQESQELAKQMRAGSNPDDDVDSRRAWFANDEEWIREEIRRFWVSSYAPSDREKFALDRQPWRMLPSFIESFLALDTDGKVKAVKAVTHIVSGRRAIENMFEDHPLREGDESSKPEVVRSDGAASRRAYIESKTPQARRLHYWRLRDGSLELSRVVLHDDFTP